MRYLALVTMTLALISTAPAFAGASRIERIVTPAGIEIWLVRDKNLPMMSLEFAFLGGAAFATLLRSGWTRLSYTSR